MYALGNELGALAKSGKSGRGPANRDKVRQLAAKDGKLRNQVHARMGKRSLAKHQIEMKKKRPGDLGSARRVPNAQKRPSREGRVKMCVLSIPQFPPAISFFLTCGQIPQLGIRLQSNSALSTHITKNGCLASRFFMTIRNGRSKWK